MLLVKLTTKDIKLILWRIIEFAHNFSEANVKFCIVSVRNISTAVRRSWNYGSECVIGIVHSPL